ncbi:MAG: type I DNA topoisomerase, partial [Maioricimonas sp. JB049]
MGYTLSPLLSDWVSARLSAGRVQSAGLGLVVNREREIQAFKPDEYWNLYVTLEGEDHPGMPFRAKLVTVGGAKLEKLAIGDAGTAEHHRTKLEDAAFNISKVDKDESRRNPPPPFVTSTLQQEAARKLGFSTDQTMKVAQELYQGVDIEGEGSVGLITYMRTDSVNLADDAVAEMGSYIRDRFGDDYALEKARSYTTKTKGAQEAHEAIRPTSVLREPDTVKGQLTKEQGALYQLIWMRAVATQMAAAVYDTMVVEVAALPSDPNVPYGLEARGRALKFDGFLALYEEGTDEDDSDDSNDETDGLLPPVSAGENCELRAVEAQQSQTKPPPRFTEASFVKELERKGVGRPSTYASIVTTIFKRGYVETVKKKFVPTELGTLVVEILEDNFPDVVDVSFTSRMEEELDEIAAGEKQWVPFAETWWQPFKEQVDDKSSRVPKGAYQQTADTPCPLCGADLVVRHGQRGKFHACVRYPDCRYAVDAAAVRTDETCPGCQKGHLLERIGKGRRKLLACERRPECSYLRRKSDKRTDRTCPACGTGHLLEKKSKKGNKFYGCEMFPSCSYTEPEGGPPEQTDEDCPECGQAKLVVRQGKYGPFTSCPRYPDCRYIKSDRPAPKKTGEQCPECGEGELVVREGKKGPFTGCNNYPDCRYIKSDRPTPKKTGEQCPECGEGELVVR